MDEHSIIRVSDCVWWDSGLCKYFERIDEGKVGALECSKVPHCTLKDGAGLTGENLRRAFEFNHDADILIKKFPIGEWPSPDLAGYIINCAFPSSISTEMTYSPRLAHLAGWNGAWQKVRHMVRERLHREYCLRQHLGHLSCSMCGLGGPIKERY